MFRAAASFARQLSSVQGQQQNESPSFACVSYLKEKRAIEFTKQKELQKTKMQNRKNTIFQVYLFKSEMCSWIEIVQKTGDFLGVTLDKPQK